ncbi:MAG: hypothetical protein ACOC1N_05605 [Bacillota bacterium]
MIFNKFKFYIIILSVFIFTFFSGIFTASRIENDSTSYIFLQGDKLIQKVNSSDLKLPLPKPSLITTEVNEIRLDLEKISVNKFFIVYSSIYGNQSHTAYHLYLTDLDKNDLDKDSIGQIYLLTSEGEKIQPVAQVPVIRDFPEDQPLEWKIKIIVKFPYHEQRSVHDLVFNYNNQEFRLTGIYY